MPKQKPHYSTNLSKRDKCLAFVNSMMLSFPDYVIIWADSYTQITGLNVGYTRVAMSKEALERGIPGSVEALQVMYGDDFSMCGSHEEPLVVIVQQGDYRAVTQSIQRAIKAAIDGNYMSHELVISTSYHSTLAVVGASSWGLQFYATGYVKATYQGIKGPYTVNESAHDFAKKNPTVELPFEFLTYCSVMNQLNMSLSYNSYGSKLSDKVKEIPFDAGIATSLVTIAEGLDRLASMLKDVFLVTSPELLTSNLSQIQASTTSMALLGHKDNTCHQKIEN